MSGLWRHTPSSSTATEEASALTKHLRTGPEEARQQLTEADTERDRLNAELATALSAVDAEEYVEMREELDTARDEARVQRGADRADRADSTSSLQPMRGAHIRTRDAQRR